jgi:tRNA (cytidine/uridine-2'-O-)-methyltransferase
MSAADPLYHVVLIRPDIAGNTGNIGRSCMALGCRLHLVHPLGYKITDANLKRAGMDYWPNLDLKEHKNLEAWLESLDPEPELYLLSTKAGRDFSAKEVGPGATLVFGSETAGLPQEIWNCFAEKARKIPMDPRARSLYLSASVAMVLGSLIL